MDLPALWRRLLARYWWIAVVVAIVAVLANIGSALTFIEDGILPRAAVVASALSGGEWAAVASMALSLALLAAILWSVRRTVALDATSLRPSRGGGPPGDTLTLLEAYKDQAERYQRLYEEEERRSWTHSGLRWGSREIPPRRKGDRYGIQVTVESEEPIDEPIKLRFWFSEEVQDPRVAFIPDSQDTRPRPTSRFVLPEEATVHPGGRVDVCWGTGFNFIGESKDVLKGSGRIKLTVYAKTPETPLEARNVERRARLS